MKQKISEAVLALKKILVVQDQSQFMTKHALAANWLAIEGSGPWLLLRISIQQDQHRIDSSTKRAQIQRLPE